MPMTYLKIKMQSKCHHQQQQQQQQQQMSEE
jgi:hypothetical protein